MRDGAIRRAMRHVLAEQRRNERIVSIGHIAIGIAVGILALVTRDETSRPAYLGMLVAVPVLVSFGGMALLMLRTSYRLDWLPYVGVVLEVVLVTGILVAVGGHASFKGAGFLGYFLVIAVAGLRFSPLLALTATVLSSGAYVTTFIALVQVGRVAIATMSEALAGPYMSVALLIQQNAFLLMVGGLLAGVATRTRRRLATVLDSERTDQQHQLPRERSREALVRLVATELARGGHDRPAQTAESAGGREVPARSVPAHGSKSASLRVAIVAYEIAALDALRADLSRDALVGLIDRVFSEVIDAVLSLGGTIYRLTDRGIIAIFGAPASRDADEEMALQSAERIRDRIEEDVRVGIHSGIAQVYSRSQVVVGERSVDLAVLAARTPEAGSAPAIATADAYRRLRIVTRATGRITVEHEGESQVLHVISSTSGAKRA